MNELTWGSRASIRASSARVSSTGASWRVRSSAAASLMVRKCKSAGVPVCSMACGFMVSFEIDCEVPAGEVRKEFEQPAEWKVRPRLLLFADEPRDGIVAERGR